MFVFRVNYEVSGKRKSCSVEALSECDALTVFHEKYGYEPRVINVRKA